MATNIPETRKNVAVIGATPKPERYAHMAMQRLLQHGYRPIPVNPAFDSILGEQCYKAIGEVPEPIDTVTMYVGPARSTPLIEEIIGAKPRRIIFNPGAENPQLAEEARKRGIEVVEGCTLVMLGSGAF